MRRNLEPWIALEESIREKVAEYRFAESAPDACFCFVLMQCGQAHVPVPQSEVLGPLAQPSTPGPVRGLCAVEVAPST
eukprot:1609815-Heterocapsa_arctica.AAC.1